ncbi:hypothetical protein [Endozoicomonas sp. ALB091]|uniref:hypothetical protein n=1 Tax=Endozoicomonas sp. ALB091 TaxID=3403073 RepID=UPI003BB6E4B3
MNQALYEFLKAFDDDTLSEGAHQAIIMEGVEAFNELHNTGYDAFDTWLAYIKRKYKMFAK